MRTSVTCLVICLLLLVPATAQRTVAQSVDVSQPSAVSAAPPTPAGETVRSDDASAQIGEMLKAAKQAIETKPPLPEVVLKVYGEANTLLEKARSILAKRESLLAEVQGAPTRVKELKADLEKGMPPLPGTASLGASLVEVEELHRAAKAQLSALEQARDVVAARSKNLERRVGEIPDEVARAAQALAEAQKRQEGALPEDTPVGIAAATALLRMAEIQDAAATVRLLEIEREHAGTVGEVVHLELSVSEQQIDYARKVEKQWSEALEARRREQGLELVRKAQEMQRAFAGSDRVLKELCAENVSLAEEASGTNGVFSELRRTRERHRTTEGQLGRIKSDYTEIQARLQLMGLTKGIGGLLLEYRDTLPWRRSIESQLAASRSELNAAQLRSLQLGETSRRVRKGGPVLQPALKEMGLVEDTPEWRSARQNVQQILDMRRDLLTDILKGYSKYQGALSEAIAVEQDLLKTVEEVLSFINENVLWVRNMPVAGPRDIRLAGQAIRSVSLKRAWSELAADGMEDFRAHPIRCGGALLLAMILVASQLISRRRIPQLGQQVAEHPPGTFRATFETVFWTATSGLAWPVLFWVVAWRLTATTPNAATTVRLSEALNITGYVLLLLCLVNQSSRPHGLGAAHLKMDRLRLEAARSAMRLLALLVLPLLFIRFATHARPTDEESQALGRLANIVSQLILAVLVGVLLKRTGKLVRGEAKEGKTGFLYRSWWFWYPLAVAVPLALAAASIAGYDYTASEIGSRFHVMSSLVLAALVVYRLVVRGLWLLRREMVRREVHTSREAEKQIEDEQEREQHNEQLREAVGQVKSISERTERLVFLAIGALLVVGVYAIWQDLLPAFRFLGRTTLYSVGDDPITLADLLAAVVASVITVAAVRTLPGMVEVYFLPHSRMAAGERFAVATILRYLLVIVGIAVVSGHFGLSWQNVQWIIAALGVGLGFGLQELVANFFSGLVLLLEQRVRIRDVVTVGESTGHVTSIHSLSTTITDWNNKELVIPNKEFIAGRVVNWTLSERTIRLEIPVGVAYGSDTREAEEVLVRVGNENESTLDDPPVQARFLGFGESSLEFVLHVWLPNMEDWLQVRHELHMAIDEAFRAAGITIAFPQLDVHLATSDIRETGERTDNQTGSPRPGRPPVA